jgi:diadenosine tetraphosphatase ApaH/serine/threonine PP2A family protein phosphatase
VRYGIFADIHANEPALDAVLAALEGDGVDRLLCLGDLVGYGADARACVDKVRGLGIPVIAGNHDWAVAGRLGLEYFNPHARDAVLWTREQLTEEDLTWLAGLETLQIHASFTLAHGTVHDPDAFEYLTTGYDAYRSFSAMTTDVGFVGHSHVPVAFFFDGTAVTYSVEADIEVGGRRVIANPGSVGQPRDEDPRAAYLIYDEDASRIHLRRVVYDIEEASRRILDAGLPPILAERLHIGR